MRVGLARAHPAGERRFFHPQNHRLLTTAILLGAHSYDKTGTSAFFDVACHCQSAQGTDREPPKLAHVRQPMTEVINPAWGFLARSKRGTRPMPAWLFGGTRQRRIQFCASGWEETKEGAAVWWRSPDDRTWL